MSESDGEQAARSLALELAYVHEVYEQCADRIVKGKLWPKVCEFLRELEPGALHCDIGSGDGKYLKVNPRIFSVGVDRCASFTAIARGEGNEVMICDNLYLPYKDESYDGITSIGVVHHFSSTDRRIKAIREIARVLKIGGRVLITVWAMEQKNRKFESQDVLVPWPKAYCVSSSGSPMKPRGMSYDERSSRSKHAQTYLLSKSNSQRKASAVNAATGNANSSNGNGYGNKSKSYWIDPTFSPSPSTSSLSSPNETCYSFFRRALQKLAGGRRNSRAWFLENWQNGRDRYEDGDNDDDDGDDVDNLPIELRRLEDPSTLPAALASSSSSSSHNNNNNNNNKRSSSSSNNNSSSSNNNNNNNNNSNSNNDNDNSNATTIVTTTATTAEEAQLSQQDQQSDSLSVKSKSLSSILDVERRDLVRSRSSIPGFTNDSLDEQEKQQHAAAAAAAATVNVNVNGNGNGSPVVTATRKPRLVKQKTHFTDDDDDPCLVYEDDDGGDNLGSLPNNSHDTTAITAKQNLAVDAPDSPSLQSSTTSSKRGNVVHKQSSMNEEFLSIERLKERESVRKNIMKQASLNEEFLYKSRPAFEAFRDTFYSAGSASKRFQLLKDSLASRIKQSTTNIEKVSGEVFKNGINIIMQTLKPTESQSTGTTSTTTTSSNGSDSAKAQTGTFLKRDGSVNYSMDSIERRLSREDGSDSSKDSSLQSDTSVESEESFASVIFIEKKHSSPMIETMVAPTSPTAIFHQQQRQQLSTTSAPPSPRVKYAPDLMSSTHRLKSIGLSPLSKQFPATSKSLPPPSPPGLSPRTLNSANMKPFFSGNEVMLPDSAAGSGTSLTERIAEVKRSFNVQPLPAIPILSTSDDKSITKDVVVTAASTTVAAVAAIATNVTVTATVVTVTAASTAVTNTPSAKATLQPRRASDEQHILESRRPSLKTMHDYKSMSGTIDSDDEEDRVIEEETSLLINDAIDEACERLSEKPLNSSTTAKSTTKTTPKKTSTKTTDEEDSRTSRLNQIKELLRQKPGFATRTRPAFPIVRRASTTATSGRLESVTKILPRLLSLELFNPETDDLDSDSSGVSSPESGGSVISVISDERYISKKESQDGNATNNKSDENSSGEATDSSKDMASASGSTKLDESSSGDAAELSQKSSTSDSDSLIELSIGSSKSSKQVESSTNVASSLEDAVNNLIKQKEATKIALPKSETVTRPTALDTRISPIESTWNEECNRHLIDLTDRLSGTLKNDSDQFSTRYTGTCKYDSGLKQQQQQQQQPRQTRDNDYCDLDNNNQRANEDEGQLRPQQTNVIERSCSEESDAGSSSTSSFVVITNSGEFLTERELRKSSSGRALTQQQQKQQRFNNSMESSDIGDSIENTISESSQAESLNTRRFCSGSTASLASSSLTTDHGPRVRLAAQTRSSSEEIPSRNVLLRHSSAATQQHSKRSATSTSNGTLSGSSSQESLPSDHMTHHQYYHVFREGELDELINKYVENLHIISSYYDHASWCIVAEKVQVWTI